MVTLAVGKEGTAPNIGPRLAPGIELTLRVLAAALQIATTLAVVRALPPPIAGLYFRGAVIAYGLAAVLRGKYDLFIAHCFVSTIPLNCGVPHRPLVRALGIRVLLRSAIACAVLLVVTSDLDVVEPRLRPFLETYLPFVLAVPCATLALFLSAALRAVNRTLGSVIVAGYCMNAVILTVAVTASGLPADSALFILSWGFFVGAAVAALVGVLVTRRVFEVPAEQIEVVPTAWKQIYATAGTHGQSGLALAALQWGPLCLLALLGSAVQIAEYAVVTRTAQIIDFLVPAVIIVPQSTQLRSRFARARDSELGKLSIDLAVSLATTSACVLTVGVLTPWFADLYGAPYSGLALLFVLLFAVQWINGVSRPALRYLTAHWDLGRNRRILLSGAAAAIMVPLLGVPRFGPVAAAAGGLVAVLLQSALSLRAAFKGCRGGC
ncbi:MAG TPA: hypothetical protein VJQ47_06580 [Steroidobacteraceae bacterium]|nr:hypothetical protein [Steroidobacteraceae bacterium]